MTSFPSVGFANAPAPTPDYDPFEPWPYPRAEFKRWLEHEGYKPNTVTLYTRLVAKAQREHVVSTVGPQRAAWVLYNVWLVNRRSDGCVSDVVGAVVYTLDLKGSDLTLMASAYAKLTTRMAPTEAELWSVLSVEEHAIVVRYLEYINEARERILHLPPLVVPVRSIEYDEAVGLVARALLPVLKPQDALAVKWNDLTWGQNDAMQFHVLRVNQSVKLPSAAMWVMAQRLKRDPAEAAALLFRPNVDSVLLRFSDRLLSTRDLIEQAAHPVPRRTSLPSMPPEIALRFMLKKTGSVDAE